MWRVGQGRTTQPAVMLALRTEAKGERPSVSPAAKAVPFGTNAATGDVGLRLGLALAPLACSASSPSHVQPGPMRLGDERFHDLIYEPAYRVECEFRVPVNNDRISPGGHT